MDQIKFDTKLAPSKRPEPIPKLWYLLGATACILFAWLIANGGRIFPSIQRPRERLTNDADLQGNLNFALEALHNQRESGDGSRTIHYLNQWSELGGTKIDWKPDPLLEKIPPAVREQPAFKNLESKTFDPSDFVHLREALLLRSCATWVSQLPLAETWQPWLNEVEQKSGAETKEQLAVAIRLFDWTIRNVQLEALPPPPPAPTASAGDDPRSQPAPLRGIPGPGYTRNPAQIMLHGTGDSWQRARLFLLLARQAGIPGAILAIQTGNSAWEATPWVAAVIVDKHLYLFDPELGLPIPGAAADSIATLEQLLADPQLLRNLDLPGLGTYPRTAADLEKIVALIDGTPEAISLRMAALQQSLTGDRKLILAAPLAETREALWKAPGIKQVLLWRVAYETQMYGQSLQQALLRDPPRLEQYVRRYGMFEWNTAVARGRMLHLEGVFDSVDQKIGARDWYVRSRPSNSNLRLLAVSESARRELGIEQQIPPKDPERQQAIDRIAAILANSKEYATLWIGMVHYEQGKIDLAHEWFHDRIIEGAPDNDWLPSARYNLGRCYETQGEWNKARDQYVLDQSPQRYGNVLRATLIKKRLDAKNNAAEPKTETPAAQNP